jgi:DNA-binding transcriptional LysR family regulator
VELRHLRYFATVAHEGSFHRASVQLNVAQSALSRQIRDLELELNAKLFIRSVRGVKLSPAGKVLLADVRQLLLQTELTKSRAQRAAAGQFGEVQIGVPAVVAELQFVIAAFAKARRAMPDVDFRLSFINSDHQVEALTTDKLDVGVFYRRDPLPQNLIYRDIRTDAYRLLVSKKHPLTRRAKVRLTDLRDEDMNIASPVLWPTTYNEIMSGCLRGGLKPRITWDVNNEGALINLIAEGLAVGFVNSSLGEVRPLRGCTLLTVEDLDTPLHLAAVWRRDRETPAITHFVDVLSQQANGSAKTIPKKKAKA